MNLPKKSKAGRAAWREHRRQLLRPAIFGVAFTVVWFVYAGLAADGYMGPPTTVLFGLCIFSVYYYWNKSMNHIDARWGEGARGESVVGREPERLYRRVSTSSTIGTRGGATWITSLEDPRGCSPQRPRP